MHNYLTRSGRARREGASELVAVTSASSDDGSFRPNNVIHQVVPVMMKNTNDLDHQHIHSPSSFGSQCGWFACYTTDSLAVS